MTPQKGHESLPATANESGRGCAAPAQDSSPERSDGSGLVGFKKQSDTEITVMHADANRRRIAKMQRIVKGAAVQITSSLQNDGFRYRCVFGTVTYRAGVEWQPNHIRDLQRHYRRWCQRRGEMFRCVWVAELTKRGRVHYHYLIWLRRGLTPPMPDKQGWWKHGSTQVQWARKPIGYLMKYASKGDSGHAFPKGLRLYGVSGPAGELGWFRAPGWMRDFGTPGDKILKKEGCWANYSTGFAMRSPWLYISCDEFGIKLKWVGWTEFDVWFIPNEENL